MNFHHFIKNAIRIFACIFVCVYVFSALACASVEERVLHSFGTAPDGSGPVSPLVMDVKGHLYGTTEYGGSYGKGTVFKLVPANGGWKETILHHFTGGKDGAYPIAGLTLDKNGNLFGTTLQGGSTCDCGVVFELAATENFWRFSIIHSFHGADGASPSYGKLVFDGHGSLYGATQMGGSGGVGAVFRMIPRQTGWQETVIYNLSGDTVYPYGVIMVDGRLYGTSVGGSGQVSVFKLSPVKQGPWIYKQIFTFVDEESGSHLSSGVIADPLGNLYGTIPQGGANGMGLVYQLVPQGHEWVENVLHEFDYSDGASPNSLVFDSMGNLFGEAMDGGPAEKCPQPGCGVIFELGPGYSFSRLYSFDGTDGSDPQGGLIIDGDGKLYGTTAGGGAGNLGTVFRVRR